MANFKGKAKDVATAAAGLFAASKLGLLGDLLGSFIKDPKIKDIAVETFIKVTKGGRTRADELVFYASLFSVQNIDFNDKILFLDKHVELTHPDLKGKTDEEQKKLKEKEALAKGLVFLLAEGSEKTDKNRFVISEKVWRILFMGVDNCLDKEAKLKLLEQRILQMGYNHQEGTPLKEILQKFDFSPKISEKISTIRNNLTASQRKNLKGLEKTANAFLKKSEAFKKKHVK